MTEPEQQRTCASCSCTLYPEERGYCDNCLDDYTSDNDVEDTLMSELVCPVCYNRHSPTVACESNHV